MKTLLGDPNSERVLALPFPEAEAVAIATALRHVGLTFQICADVKELCREITAGAGSALLTEEGLEQSAMQRLVDTLGRQGIWSDFPVVVLFSCGSESPEISLRMLSMLEPLGNVRILERPVRIMALVSALQASSRDRRRQYELRDLLRQMEDTVRNRDEFLALLAHEVRTPLSTIQNATQILNRLGSQASVAQQQRAVITRQTERLGQLIGDVLDVSRLSSGQITLLRVPVDLVGLARHRLQTLQGNNPQEQRHKITFSAPSAPVVVTGDSDRLGQVIDNLLSNALHYTPSGGRIWVTVARDGDNALLTVKDTGVGLDPEQLPNLLRGVNETRPLGRRPEGGLKIGLPLVRSLVELHNGSVTASSAGPGLGSEFTIRLPLRLGTSQPTPQPFDVGPTIGASRRILLIEDNLDGRETLRLMLQMWGHHVEVAGDGHQGLQKARATQPEVALIDIGLPGVDGYDVAQQMRAVLGRRVTLIALTGFGQPQDRQQALEKGFDAYLVKPVDPSELQKVLESPMMVTA